MAIVLWHVNFEGHKPIIYGDVEWNFWPINFVAKIVLVTSEKLGQVHQTTFHVLWKSNHVCNENLFLQIWNADQSCFNMICQINMIWYNLFFRHIWLCTICTLNNIFFDTFKSRQRIYCFDLLPISKKSNWKVEGGQFRYVLLPYIDDLSIVCSYYSSVAIYF